MGWKRSLFVLATAAWALIGIAAPAGAGSAPGTRAPISGAETPLLIIDESPQDLPQVRPAPGPLTAEQGGPTFCSGSYHPVDYYPNGTWGVPSTLCDFTQGDVEPTELILGDADVITGVGFWFTYLTSPPSNPSFRVRIYDVGFSMGCPDGPPDYELVCDDVLVGPGAGTVANPKEYFIDFSDNGGLDFFLEQGRWYHLSIQSVDCPGPGSLSFWATSNGDGDLGCLRAPDAGYPDWTPLDSTPFPYELAFYLCAGPPAPSLCQARDRTHVVSPGNTGGYISQTCYSGNPDRTLEPTDRFIGDGRILHGIGTWFGFQFPSPLTRFDDPAFFVKIYETGADGCPSSDPVYEAYCTNVEVNHKVHVPGIQSAEYLIDFEANGYAPFLKKLGVDYAISIVYDHADFCSPSTPVIAFILFAGEGGDGIYGCGRDTSSPLGWVPGAFDLAMYHCDSEGPPPPSFCVGDELGQAIPPERIGVGFLATECVEAVEPYPVEPTQLFVGDGQVLTGVGFWMHYNYAPAPPSSGFRFRVYETGPDGCPFGSALLDLTAYKISQGPEAGTPVDPIEYYCDFTLNSGGHDLRTVAGVQYALSIQSLDCPGAGATAYWAPGIGGDGSAGCVLAPDLYGPDWVPLSDVGFSGDFAMYLCTEPPADTAPFSDVSNAATADPGDGFGVAWGDYDGDDDPDLYVSNRGVANKLLRNDAGVFVDATSGALGDPGNSYSGLWGDYDGDGDVDLYIANRDTPSRLLRNDAGTFVDVTPPPLGDAALILGATWVDFDNDGDLDLYVNKLTEANRLYRNDGGSWIDVVSGPLADASTTISAAWADYDNDGDADVYLSNSGAPNKLLRNDGGAVFVDVTTGPLDQVGGAQSAAWADYDNDSDLDLYVVLSDGPNRLLRNDNGTFVEEETATILRGGAVDVGAAWGDYDNDGDQDLFVAGFGANHLYRTDSGHNTTWTDVTGSVLANTDNGRACAWADYDGDGDLDLYLANDRQPNKLYENQSVGAPLGANHWLQLDLLGIESNTTGVGAQVRVWADSQEQLREVTGGSGFNSQGSSTVEFGLGASSFVDSLEIRWPSGLVQLLTDGIPVDQSIDVEEGNETSAADLPSVPRGVALLPALPNPMSSGCSILFALPTNVERVSLAVFDLQGRRVRTLFEGAGSAGYHSVTWDARDERGRPSAAGVYLYRLEAGEISRSRKLMLIR